MMTLYLVGVADLTPSDFTRAKRICIDCGGRYISGPMTGPRLWPPSYGFVDRDAALRAEAEMRDVILHASEIR